MSSSHGLRTSLTAPPFKWSHLWEPAIVNPITLKSYTIPIFNLRDPYGRAFHLSWIGFFVAFLSWFAFPPLMPEVIKSDLKLTTAQVGSSNIIALSSPMLVRIVVGPLVDRFGPRKVMASVLILGAIPSGLAGLAVNAQSLYALRFFIGILGGSFVPCQAWTSAFFDTSCVGTANALVAGWGNMGGGATYAIMIGLFHSLTHSLRLTPHVAWRVAFAVVPVPILVLVAISVLIFGQDHPYGRWEDRPLTNNAAVYLQKDLSDKEDIDKQNKESQNIHIEVSEVGPPAAVKASPPAFVTYLQILASPSTWLPPLAYMTTFGLELLIDANAAHVLLLSEKPGFVQSKAGYYASIFGLLNVVTRPLGGYTGDVIYRFYGTNGKKAWIILCGLIMGASFLAGGLYIQNVHGSGQASFPILMAVFSIASIFSELANGACFSLVPHYSLLHNGFMSGLVGAFGNLGGIIFAVIYTTETQIGKACWIMGAVCMAVNTLLIAIPVPRGSSS